MPRLLGLGVVARGSVRGLLEEAGERSFWLRVDVFYQLVLTFPSQRCVFGSVWLGEKLSDAYV